MDLWGKSSADVQLIFSTWSICDTTSERRECRVESSLPRSMYPSKPAVLEIVSGLEISSRKRCMLVHSCSRNWFMNDMYSSLFPNLLDNGNKGALASQLTKGAQPLYRNACATTHLVKFARFWVTLAMSVSVRAVRSSGYSCIRLKSEGDMMAGQRKRRNREALIKRSLMSGRPRLLHSCRHDANTSFSSRGKTLWRERKWLQRFKTGRLH